VLAYTPACLVAFPRPLLTIAAVLAFGPWAGLACAIAGNTLAALLTYLAGRMLNRDQVRSLAGTRLSAITEALKRRGLLAITAIRLVPIAPFALENLVAGAIGIRMRDYLLGTFFGMLPGELASTIFGHQLQAALFESAPVDYLWIACAVLVLILAVMAIRRYLLRLATAHPGS
jgi:uncharacterized membrane protein YdjX (TVP38/TMEM64 family)